MTETEPPRWLYALAYNMTLWALGMVLAFFGIQHAIFFYSFPPDPSKWVYVPPTAYIFLSLLLFAVLKLWHFIEERAEVLGEE